MYKSQIKGTNYVILDAVGDFPYKVNKNATDQSIAEIKIAVKIIQDALQAACSENEDLYNFLCDNV